MNAGRVLVAVGVLAATSASAQPVPGPTPRHPRTVPNDPSAGPPPVEPWSPRLAPMTPLPVSPRPRPQPPYSPIPPPPDPFAAHHGITLEAELGVGIVYISDPQRAGLTLFDGPDPSITTPPSLAGIDLAIGGFITPRLALTVRASDVDVTSIDARLSGATITAVIGPALQYWLTPAWWLGAGGGAALFTFTKSKCSVSNSCFTGWGLDARLGYTFIKSGKLSINVAAEVTPAFYSSLDATWNATGFALVFGYQYL